MNSIQKNRLKDQAFKVWGIICTLIGLILLAVFIGDILIDGKKHLTEKYPHVSQIVEEKVISITSTNTGYKITTNRAIHFSEIIVLALNYSKPITLQGIENYIIPHERANPKKDRIQLKNTNFLVEDGLYVCGSIAGLRSQFAIAAGSGATVATDILTLWNDKIPTKIHDKA